VEKAINSNQLGRQPAKKNVDFMRFSTCVSKVIGLWCIISAWATAATTGTTTAWAAAILHCHFTSV